MSATITREVRRPAPVAAPAAAAQFRDSLTPRSFAAYLPGAEFKETAATNRRVHALRSTGRVLALLATDLAAFELVREALRTASGWPGVAAHAARLLPPGYLGGSHFGAALLLALVLMGTYGAGDARRDTGRLLGASLLAAAVPLWAGFWLTPAVALLQGVVTSGLVGAAIVVARAVLDGAIRRFAARRPGRAVLVGPSAAIREEWRADDGGTVIGDLLPVACLAVDEGGAETQSERVAGLGALLAEHAATYVILCGHVGPDTFEAIVRAAALAECRVLAATDRLDSPWVQPSILWVRGRPVIELRSPELRWHQLLAKRAVDVAGAGLLLALFAPVIALVALAVRLGSPGPAFYAQGRPGLRGRSFKCLKVRTMRTDAEAALRADPALYEEFVRAGYKLPAHRDPRITPLGRLLRRTSLDELPQLWNVLVGDMSLVGPRPMLRDEIDPGNVCFAELLSVRPGITGAWQVNGRSALPYDKRRALELGYVRTWSLGRDLAILLRTLPAVLSQRGAF